MPTRRPPARKRPCLVLMLLSVALLLCASGPALADFETGRLAYDRENYRKALKAWLPLAEAGDAEAQFWIGELYSDGKGVERDFDKAHSYYMRAALQGHPRAQLQAGDYLNGFTRRTPEERALGFALLLRAATNRETAAYISISHAYCYGEGVEEDWELADVWMVLALGPLSRFESFLHCDVMTPLTRKYHAEIVRRAEGLSLAYGFKPYGSDYQPQEP